MKLTKALAMGTVFPLLLAACGTAFEPAGGDDAAVPPPKSMLGHDGSADAIDSPPDGLAPDTSTQPEAGGGMDAGDAGADADPPPHDAMPPTNCSMTGAGTAGMQCLEAHALRASFHLHTGIDLYLFDRPMTCSELAATNFAQGTRFLLIEALAGEVDGAPREMTPGTYAISSDLDHLTYAYVYEESPQCKLEGSDKALSGSVTIEAITDKKVKGTFSLVFSFGPINGTFDTWFCDGTRGDAGAPRCTP